MATIPIRSPEWLLARAKLAEDWYREGKITYTELVRLQMDQMVGEDNGPVRWMPSKEPK